MNMCVGAILGQFVVNFGNVLIFYRNLWLIFGNVLMFLILVLKLWNCLL